MEVGYSEAYLEMILEISQMLETLQMLEILETLEMLEILAILEIWETEPIQSVRATGVFDVY